MKTQLLLLGITSSFLANAATPVLVKTTNNGTVSPAYQHTTKCEIYADKVITTNTANSLSTVTTVAASLSNAIDKAIWDASKGTLTKKTLGVGGGGSSWTAYASNGSAVTLKVTGNTTITNDAPASVTLTNLIDLTCK